MNLALNRSSLVDQDVSELPTALAKWYAAHASIRRLWAIEDSVALIVFVTLEPTSDGDDTLPVWMAKHRDWASDLRVFTDRDVHLKLFASGILAAPSVTADAVVIAELSWRDSWESF